MYKIGVSVPNIRKIRNEIGENSQSAKTNSCFIKENIDGVVSCSVGSELLDSTEYLSFFSIIFDSEESMIKFSMKYL